MSRPKRIAYCDVGGCGIIVVARDLCEMHYRRWLKHGSTDKAKRKIAPGKYRKIGKRLEHVLIVERAIGHSLPPKAEVHHIDGNKQNNTPSNLVVCPNRAYHKLLHKRQEAKAACGKAHWLKCWICRKYGPPRYFHVTTSSDKHKLCWNKYQRERYANGQ